MIQRIQSIFLGLAALFLLSTVFLPVAEMIREGQTMGILLSGLMDEETGLFEQNLWQPTLCFMTAFISIATIFMYKDRNRQMRITRLNMILTAFLSISTPVMARMQMLRDTDLIIYKVPVVFPAVAAILLYLAFRGIKKDDDLVKSADRLR
jgi:membrane-associated HD superfamily phosphohydrolase